VSTAIRTSSGERPYAATAIALCTALFLSAAQTTGAAPGGQPPAARNWHPPGCPPPAETGKGSSNVTVTGPCAFTHTADAECDAEGDDFLVTVVRRGRNSAELVLFLNIERFVGPRTYKAPNDMWLSLKAGSNIYRWSTNDYVATVGPGSKSVTFKEVRLEPEPLLVDCTGPQTNYQCDGRGSDTNLDASMTIVSGTIHCKPGRTKSR
jgi:hypothetical protein